MEIGATIRKIRIGLGIKQEELASALDVSQSYLSKIESNRSKIYVDDLVKIAGYMNTPLTAFFTDISTGQTADQDKKQRDEIILLLKEQQRFLQQLVDKDK